jgi:uncharacterized Ntn-hydrolase superfamily protein
VTFSLAGRCRRTGMLGIVVSSSSPAVAARCAHARAGVGAAASQNVTDPRLGVRLLDRLDEGAAAADALARLVADEPLIAHRQLTVVDRWGGSAVHSGERTLGVHAARALPDAAAAGNLLADPAVPQAMLDAFQASPQEHLGRRLVAALAAGLAAGGEAGPVRSAGMLVVDRVAWPVADLRVDWHDQPVAELAALWELWQPQLDDYLKRALDPGSAPGYGVAGED